MLQFMFKPHNSLRGEVSLPEEETHTFTIVVLFDSAEALHTAESTCAFVENKMDHAMPVEKAFFNARYLQDGNLQLAAREAARADMVVVACSKMSSPTTLLADWTDQWVNEREAEGGVVVALLNEPLEGDQDLPILSYLQEKAAAAGMDFICRQMPSGRNW